MSLYSIDVLKRNARRICKAEGTPHTQALNQLAQKHGYKHYDELQRQSTNGRFSPKTQ